MATTKPKRGGRDGRDRELEASQIEASYRVKIRLIEGAFSLLRTALRGAILLGGLYIAAIGAAPFAGRNTQVIALVRALVEFRADRYILAITTALASGAWWQQRRKRTKLITDWGDYIKQLEAKVDPEGSSSGLLKTGRPKKEDTDAL